jgi:cobaltochelatase CobN
MRAILILFLLLSAVSAHAGKLALLVIDGDSTVAYQGVADLDLAAVHQVRSLTLPELTQQPDAAAFVAAADVVLVDVMSPELSAYLVDHDLIKGKTVYALRGSRDDARLRQQGFVFDAAISGYFADLSRRNVTGMIKRALHQALDSTVDYPERVSIPATAIHHPDAEQLFDSVVAYKQWYVSRYPERADYPWVALTFYITTLRDGQVEAADALIKKLEESGFNPLPCFGRPDLTFEHFLHRSNGRPPADLLLSFTLKFWSALNAEVKQALKSLDIPVFNLVRLYGTELEAWRESPVGIAPLEVSWAIANPETTGAIEPTVISAKRKKILEEGNKPLYYYDLVDENVDHLLLRINAWSHLQHTANHDKKVALLYYNHSQGKQNIGASYLNVFRSVAAIIARMQAEGYRISGDGTLSEEKVRQMILRSGRNIGSWAPGELDALLAEGEVELVPIATYRRWFDALPEAFTRPVLDQWGEPEQSDIMTKDGNIILPMVRLGNLVLLPEPSRGWSDDPIKLYHDPTVYPHHQYIAAYLWLQHQFNADAMIHLGTHATYEWLPGKQAGLAASDPSEIMVGNIPNVYPYIVDDVGEGIQAKRRGRGVIIDHLTPALKDVDLHDDLSVLRDLLSRYELSAGMGGATAAEYLQQIDALLKQTGIGEALAIDKMAAADVEKIDHYLHEVDDGVIPFGMHTFGTSYAQEGLDSTLEVISAAHPDLDRQQLEKNLTGSAQREMDQLINALGGGYICAGEGNDPLRNPHALPTGKNFYGFSAARLPSKAAWKLGQKAAEDLIAEQRAEDGGYPHKVAVVLWAVESIRNEGVNESTILALLGMEPIWDSSGRVTGTRPVPGKQLGRPRIDVLVNPSGLYRDLFPEKLLWLDDAIQQAALQTDIENILAENNGKLEAALLEQGLRPEQAAAQSRLRIFTEKPGSYGNGVSELAGASGFWESDQEIAGVFLNRSSYAIGNGQWGVPSRQLLTENLKEVDTAVHSISSNIYATMDNDDMFQYLGGLSLAVRTVRGEAPKSRVTLQKMPGQVEVAPLKRVISQELQQRYLNPQWIEGMKQENYAGAHEMAKFVEYLWGWQVTTPDAVVEASWNQVKEVYVDDKYRQGLKDFFAANNPWAYQSITARMLEAVRKGYWHTTEQVQQQLAREYIDNVLRQGVACCDHTCNNPVLNQMVINIASLPGVMDPRLVEQFKIAIEKMAQSSLEEQLEQRQELQCKLQAGFEARETARRNEQQTRQEKMQQAKSGGPEDRQVTGYKMDKVSREDETTELSSSGIQWLAAFSVMVVLAVVAGAIWWRRRQY